MPAYFCNSSACWNGKGEGGRGGGVVGQPRGELGSLAIKALNSVQCGPQLFDQYQDLQVTGDDDTHVFCQVNPGQDT